MPGPYASRPRAPGPGRVVHRRALAIIDVGDRVRINRHIRPFYVRGSPGTVTDWSGRSAIVSLDVPTGRYAEVRCPAIGPDRMASECGD
jgi:hypothetical protein